MRRLFWMIAGALVGVTGYRRVSRLARAVTAGGRRGAAADRPRRRDRERGGWTRGVALFARDVRDGMELYLDHHPFPAGPTLEGQRARARGSHRAGADRESPGRAQAGVDYAKDDV